MSNPIPATDEQIAALNADLRRREDEHYFFEASVSLGLSLIARIESEKAANAELRGAMAASDDRLSSAGTRVGIAFGCDTADAMADEILSLRAEVRRLEDDVLSEASFAEACGGLKAMARAILARREGRQK